jgi:L-lactate dehydrogenase complex protein LldG
MASDSGNESRSAILGDIRAGLGQAGLDLQERHQRVDQRLSAHEPGPRPARATVSGEQAVMDFTSRAIASSATVTRLPDWSALPVAVAEYLRGLNLPASLRVAPDPALEALDWLGAGALETSFGSARDSDAVALNRAFAGVAETATLVCYARETSATTLNFLPDTSILVLEAGEIVGSYEDAWAKLRAATGFDGSDAKAWPRTVNWISGPSRTADVEQTIQLGAHGPRRLQVFIIGEPG